MDDKKLGTQETNTTSQAPVPESSLPTAEDGSSAKADFSTVISKPDINHVPGGPTELSPSNIDVPEMEHLSPSQIQVKPDALGDFWDRDIPEGEDLTDDQRLQNLTAISQAINDAADEAGRGEVPPKVNKNRLLKKVGIWSAVVLVLGLGLFGFIKYVQHEANANPIQKTANAYDIEYGDLTMTLPPTFLENGDYYQAFRKAQINEQLYLGVKEYPQVVDDAQLMKFYIETIQQDGGFAGLTALEPYPLDNLKTTPQYCRATMTLPNRDGTTNVDFLLIPYMNKVYYIVYSWQENADSQFKDLMATLNITDEQDPPEPVAPTPDSPDSTPTIEAYKAGSYVVGENMPEGVYIVVADTEVGGLIEVVGKADEKAKKETTLYKEAVTTNTYGEVKAGEKVTLTNATAYPLTANVTIGLSDGGMYKVGRDIDPGKYQLTSQPGSKGYYEISNDARHTIDGIQNNENFTGTKEIELKDGQYVILLRVTVTKVE